jgi:YVTN family beta-propeller protein
VTQYYSNTVSVVDTATNVVIATVGVGNNPSSVAITPDGTFAYVADANLSPSDFVRFNGDVSVIDTTTKAVTAVIPLDSNPNGIAISPDGALVPTHRTGNRRVRCPSPIPERTRSRERLMWVSRWEGRSCPAVQGTLTVQTQVVAAPKAPSSQGGGVVAIAVEVHQDLIDPNRRRTAISTVHSRGTRAAPDFMRLPGLPLTAECVGDCDGDFAVTVDEILMGVSIALGEDAVSACPQLDPDGKGQVTVDEVLTAVDNALNGCPAH